MWIIESGFLWSGGSTTSKDVCFRCYFYQNAWVKAWPDKTFYENTTKICSNWSNNWVSWYGSSSNQCNTCNSGYILLNNTWVSNSLISSANFISAVSYILVLISLIVMLMKNCNLPLGLMNQDLYIKFLHPTHNRLPQESVITIISFSG